MTTIRKNGGIISFRQNNRDIEYSFDETSWTDISSFPITIVNNIASTSDLTILFITNITVLSNNFYFICGSDNIIFDGQNNSFRFNKISSYSGLFRNGTSSSNGKNNITIQNIITTTTSSSLADDAAWICQKFFGRGSKNLFINDCINKGPITGKGSAGVMGAYTGSEGGSIKMFRVVNEGMISADDSGAIFGRGACKNKGDISMINSKNSAPVTGKNSGATVGSTSGVSGGVLRIQGFENEGEIGPNAGFVGKQTNALVIESSFGVANDYLMFVSDVVVGTEDLTFNIIGTNLSHVNYVLINDIIIPASFVVNGDTSINVTLSEYIVVNSVKIFTDLDYYIFNVIPPIFPICFPAGTPVLTDQGIINIEKINPKNHTIQNKKIVAVTQTITNENHLVCIEKNALGNNIPSQQTIMSSNHCVVYKNKFIPARNLKNFIENKQDIYNIKYDNEILYNILMETHETINVNNMIVETLHPENIFAKLYYGKYSKKNIIFDLNDCMEHNNFKKCKQICNK
jgi:hypothetical protein